MSARILSTRAKLLASAALLAAAAGAAGLGTFGSFTSTTSASESVNSGTVSIAVGAVGATNRLSVAATGIVPGDAIQRAVTLTNGGDQTLSAITLTTTASPSSLLDTDVTNGLQLKIDKCAAGWVEAGTAPAYTYTCTAGAVPVLLSRPVVGANLALTALSSLTNGNTDNLVVTLTMPSTAGNNLMGQSSVVNFSFTGTQRAGTNK